MNLARLAFVLALPLFAADLKPQTWFLGAAEGYSLWLSDTSLTAQLNDRRSLAMQFPNSRCTPSRCFDVFPGVDLHIYRHGAKFEYDWIVAPNADPSAIRLTFTESPSIDTEGDLVLSTATGELRHEKPFAYQDIDGVRRVVPASFNIAANGEVGFTLGLWSSQHPLVIDPALSFATGVGGFTPGIAGADSAQSVAVDSTGNIYVAGHAASADFPLVNPLPLTRTASSCAPVFAAKISPDGKTLLYSTLLANMPAPAGCTALSAIAVDAEGNAYITGTLFTGASFVGNSTIQGVSDVFLMKLDPAGTLKGTATFGGAGADTAQSITFGPDGNLYLAGTTTSTDFPVSSGAVRTSLSSAQDIFIMKLNPSSLSVIYSTFLAQGTSATVTADAAGNAYVAASTTSTAWPVTAGVVQPACAGRTTCADVTATKIKPDGTALLYATYLGGSDTDTAAGIAIDGAGSLYITGITSSGDFPTTPKAFVPAFDPASARDAQTTFAVKLSPDAASLTYATLLTPLAGPKAAGIAVDTAGNAYIAGTAGAADLSGWPLTIQLSAVPLTCYTSNTGLGSPTGEVYCPQSGYLAALNPSGSALLWGTYLGSGYANSVTLDASGNVVVAGYAIAMRKTSASPATGNGAGIVKIAPGGTSGITAAVQNAAQFETGLPAPGDLAALYARGVNVSGTIVAPNLPLPTTLGGVTVLVDDVPAPIVAVAGLPGGTESQVNFQVPFEVAVGQDPAPHMVEVRFNGQSAFVSPQQTAPGIFTLGAGGPAIQHSSDYSLETLQNPVHPGEIVTAYATGLGLVKTPVPSGTGATEADPIVTGCNSLFTNAGTILYAGLTPGFPGLYQINIQLSPFLQPGIDYIYLQSQDCWLGAPPASLYQSQGVALYVQ